MALPSDLTPQIPPPVLPESATAPPPANLLLNRDGQPLRIDLFAGGSAGAGMAGRPVDVLREAKRLRKAMIDRDAVAIARVRAVFFDLAGKSDQEVATSTSLRRCQHVVAKEHGMEKWDPQAASDIRSTGEASVDRIDLIRGPGQRAIAESLNGRGTLSVSSGWTGVAVVCGSVGSGKTVTAQRLCAADADEHTGCVVGFRCQSPKADLYPLPIYPNEFLTSPAWRNKNTTRVGLCCPSELAERRAADRDIAWFPFALDPLWLTMEEWDHMLFHPTQVANPDDQQIRETFLCDEIMKPCLASLTKMGSVGANETEPVIRTKLIARLKRRLSRPRTPWEEKHFPLAEDQLERASWMLPSDGPYFADHRRDNKLVAIDLQGSEVYNDLAIILPAVIRTIQDYSRDIHHQLVVEGAREHLDAINWNLWHDRLTLSSKSNAAVILIDQGYAAALVDALRANIRMLVVHRLASGHDLHDAAADLRSMGASEDDSAREQLASLSVGEAVVVGADGGAHRVRFQNPGAIT